MFTLETIVITAFAVIVILAPKALDTWLSLRDAARASSEESMLERAAGGAE
jgi:hypothetical protein